MSRAFLAIAACMALQAQGPVPRAAPELKIVEASGRTTMLSSYRGRVVLLAFISTQCVHCQRASGVFEQLAHEFGGRLQVAVVAFNEGGNAADFSRRFGLTFPVGMSTDETAHDFLGIGHGMRLGTPQVVVIDRSGVIRAQSERLGSPILQTHDYMLGLLKAVAR